MPSAFTDRILLLEQRFASDLQLVANSGDVEQLRLSYLSKKGPVQSLVTELRNLADADRPEAGKQINDLKRRIESSLEEAMEEQQDATPLYPSLFCSILI